MAELLASNQDINAWLSNSTLEANTPNTAQLQLEAHRLIRGQLASSFLPTVLSTWISPQTTPDQIRSIAGRLIAAYLYREVFAAERDDRIPAYAQELYNEAIELLSQIRSNNITLVDIDDNPIPTTGLSMTNTDFWPNNNTTGPFFTMDQAFG